MSSSNRTETPMRDDPLREARLAVQAGQFREAWNALSEVAGSVRRTAEWSLLAAVTHFRLGEFARCRAAALQARDGFRAQGDVDGEMRAENTAGAGAFALGYLADAQQGFQRALALAHHLGDGFTTARCANNLGNVSYYLGDYPKALSFYRLATTSFEMVGSWKGRAEGWLNTAIVWNEDGNLEESDDAADRAIAAAERAGDGRVLAQALAARAETSVALGDVDLARAQVARALKISREVEDPLAEADALRILSKVEHVNGEFGRAEELARQGLLIAQEIEHPWAEAELQRELGTVRTARGRRTEAIAAFEAAATAFERLGAASWAESMRAKATELGNAS
jgi:tetratricopeptide (TPR) repeat protein